MAETFGVILAEARINKGLSLEQVSQVLRIRPAILASLEREDYFGMPLKGHSRNMVSAYSRYLGLDSAAVTELFLQNYRDFEHSEVNRHRGVQSIPIEQHNPTGSMTPSAARRAREQGINQSQGQGVRSIWDKPTPSSELHGGYDSRSPKTERSAKNAARRRAVQGSSGSAVRASDRLGGSSRGPDRLGSGSRTPITRVTGSGTAAAMRQNQSAGKSLFETLRKLMTTTPLPLVLLVILLVGLLVLWAVMANSCNRQTDDFIPVQTNGGGQADDSPNLLDDILINPADLTDDQTAVNYGPFRLAVEPQPGTAPWVQITIDGTIVVSDPLYQSMTFDVLINCEIQTGQPDNLRVTRDGVVQQFEIGENGIGTLRLEILERPVNDNTTNTPADDGTNPSGQDPATVQ